MTTHKITPDPKCGECNGDGEIFDIVPYGSTVAHLPSFCDCVTDQVEDWDDDDEIEITFHSKIIIDVSKATCINDEPHFYVKELGAHVSILDLDYDAKIHEWFLDLKGIPAK